MSNSTKCQEPCSIATDTSAGEVAALNGFYVVWKFFKLENRANAADLRHEGQAFCRRAWSSVEEEMKGVIELDKYCFRCEDEIERRK